MGRGPQPYEHYIGRICEEFHCLPSEAIREVRRMPFGMLERIIEYRHFAGAFMHYQAADTADAKKRLPAHEHYTLIEQFEMALAEEDIEANG